MYQKWDGNALGSPPPPLSPVLANIFVICHEEGFFDWDQKPVVYFRYVDDTYTIFKTEADCDTFLKRLNNSLQTALKFTFEKEINDPLPFLDVLVENLTMVSKKANILSHTKAFRLTLFRVYNVRTQIKTLR